VHNWTDKCGLWELPYSKALILMHIIDVLHQECNDAESMVMTCMNFLKKSKDNKQAKNVLAMICHRPSLELTARGTKPQAPFCLKAKERKEVMMWMKNLKFPDGLAAGFRRAVNFVTWFKEHALRASNVHRDLCQLSYGYITIKKYGQYDVIGFHFCSTVFEDARPLAVTCIARVVVRAVDDEGRETNYDGVTKYILELTFGGDKDLRVAFFFCDWFDPTRGTRKNKYGMVEIKHEEQVRGHDNFILGLQCQQVYYMTYPCPKLSAWWVVHKVNPRELLPIHSDSCYHACNLEDEENCGIVQEHDLATSINVEISEGLDSLVGDPNDVEEVVMKRKCAPAQKKKEEEENEMAPLLDRVA
jgi:hypothetical protein